MTAKPLLLLTQAQPWVERAECATGHDPDLWFTPDSEAGFAKEVCKKCPVKADCLAWALTEPSMQGVLGGLTESERRNLRRRSSRDTTRAACGTSAGRNRHRDLREPVCDQCRDAYNRYARDVYRSKMEKLAAEGTEA